jgi:hypothetical protein
MPNELHEHSLIHTTAHNWRNERALCVRVLYTFARLRGRRRASRRSAQ